MPDEGYVDYKHQTDLHLDALHLCRSNDLGCSYIASRKGFQGVVCWKVGGLFDADKFRLEVIPFSVSISSEVEVIGNLAEL